MRIKLISVFVFIAFQAYSQLNITNNCDSVSNLVIESPYHIYEFSSAWGYMGGTNGNNFAEWADLYTGTVGGYITEIWFMPGKVYAGTPSSFVKFNVYQANQPSSGPGSILGSQNVLVNSMQVDQWNQIILTSPISVTSNFFLGFQVNYSNPQDTFCILSNSPQVQNTAWFKYPIIGWMSYANFMNNQVNTHYAMAARICDSPTSNSAFVKSSHPKVFPNPATNSINVFDDALIDKIYLYNIKGEIVYESNVADYQTTINIENFPAGNYFIRYEANNKHIHTVFTKL